MDPRSTEYLLTEARYTAESLQIGGAYVMHEWERPLIRRMVEDLSISPADRVLEIGFGMGISATIIQEFRPTSHVIIEPHPQVLAHAKEWRRNRECIDIREGYWQQLDDCASSYSAIFFDPFSNEMELVDDENIAFLKFASRSLLEEGGRISMFCIRPVLPAEYQKVMFEHYRHVEISSVQVEPRETASPTLNGDGYMISVLLRK